MKYLNWIILLLISFNINAQLLLQSTCDKCINNVPPPLPMSTLDLNKFTGRSLTLQARCPTCFLNEDCIDVIGDASCSDETDPFCSTCSSGGSITNYNTTAFTAIVFLITTTGGQLQLDHGATQPYAGNDIATSVPLQVNYGDGMGVQTYPGIVTSTSINFQDIPDYIINLPVGSIVPITVSWISDSGLLHELTYTIPTLSTSGTAPVVSTHITNFDTSSFDCTSAIGPTIEAASGGLGIISNQSDWYINNNFLLTDSNNVTLELPVALLTEGVNEIRAVIEAESTNGTTTTAVYRNQFIITCN